jgi:hypothetical protein
MAEWIQRTLTFGVVMGFIIGLFAGQIANWAQYRYRLKKNPDKVVKRSNWEAVIGIMVAITLVWIMVSTQQARNCAITLNTSLEVEITAGKMEREAFQNAVAAQQTLPKEIQDLPQQDPVKKAAMKPIEDQYFSEVAKAKKIRSENAGARNAAQRACGQS